MKRPGRSTTPLMVNRPCATTIGSRCESAGSINVRIGAPSYETENVMRPRTQDVAARVVIIVTIPPAVDENVLATFYENKAEVIGVLVPGWGRRPG